MLVLRLLLTLCGTRRDGGTQGEGPIYVFGSFRAATGLGKGACLYLEQCIKDGREVYGVDVTSAMLQTVVLPQFESQFPGKYAGLSLTDLVEPAHHGSGTVVIHANPPLFQLLLMRLPKTFLQNKRLVAFWNWELEHLPASYIMAIPYVDAVEVPSSFTAQAVRRETKKKVCCKPYVLPSPKRKKTQWCANGRVHCLFLFDMASDSARKNPEAAIAAFTKAFSADEAILTIKVLQQTEYPDDFARLAAIVQGYSHVQILADHLSRNALEQLYLDNDIYISLHRSEGYGLTIHEAMNYGLYAVATGWSANMDFMIGEKAFPVPYKLESIKAGFGIYKSTPHARWAEPDIDAAACILRNIYTLIIRNEQTGKEE